MTLAPTNAGNASTTSQLSTELHRPAFIVRMSAIGDTLMAARTHSQLRSRGYAPFLLTHKNNASLLECMPLLAGACLLSDAETSFLLRDQKSNRWVNVGAQTFAEHLHAAVQSSNQPKTKPIIPILDLQNTRRSGRAIRTLERSFAQATWAFEKHAVAKQTLWRILLVLWSYLALRQWTQRTPPRFLLRTLKSVHRLQAEMIEKLPTHSQPHMTATAAALQTLSIAQAQQRFAGKHIVFFVGASFRLKAWPREHFRTLRDLILQKTNCTIVLCGGRDDMSVGEFLMFPEQDRVVNCIGKTSLAETLALIGEAQYVVTGDSFAAHAADLLGRPASVLFGSTHPLLGFAPEGSHCTVHHTGLSCSPCSRHGQGDCRFKNLRCLTGIKPEEVFSKIEQQLRLG